MVDWSARSAPATGADSIWIAESAGGDAVQLSNPPTRRAAARRLDEVIGGGDDERILIGVDASLGYPVGSADLFGLTGTPWRAMWSAVSELSEDDEHNRNNRFAVAAELNRRVGRRPGPFWGCPPSKSSGDLAPRKPNSFPVAEFRRTEQQLRAAGLRPASGWQLFGIGSVGGQTLTLLPILSELSARWRGRLDTWPFTTGLSAPRVRAGRVVVAEVWPTMWGAEVGGSSVKDAVQVDATVRALSAADRAGELVGWFTPQVTADVERDAVNEEGWVVGVTDGWCQTRTGPGSEPENPTDRRDRAADAAGDASGW